VDEDPFGDEEERRLAGEERWARRKWAREKQKLEEAAARQAAADEGPRSGPRLPAPLAAFIGLLWGLLGCLFVAALEEALSPGEAEKAAAAMPGWSALAVLFCLVAAPIACALRPACAAGILRGAALGLAVAVLGSLVLWVADKGLGRWESVYWVGSVVGFGGIGGFGTLVGL